MIKLYSKHNFQGKMLQECKTNDYTNGHYCEMNDKAEAINPTCNPLIKILAMQASIDLRLESVTCRITILRLNPVKTLDNQRKRELTSNPNPDLKPKPRPSPLLTYVVAR